MKRSFLLAIYLLIAGFSATGQSFTFQNGDTSTVYSVASDIKVYNKIKATSSTALNLKWKVDSHDIPSGWVLNGICDNNLCYTDTQDLLGGTNYYTGAYNNSTFDNFYVWLNASGAPLGSSAVLTIQVSDTGAHYNKMVTFIAKKQATGVTTVTKVDDDVTIYPNPAREALNVVFNDNMGVRNIAVYNLIGKIVSIYKVHGNSAKLDLTEVPSGIYFVRLMNSQGQIVATRKFTHQ